MTTFMWPAEDGWPYPDEDGGTSDAGSEVGSEVDDDLVALHCLSSHALDSLEPLERQVVTGRFGIGGAPVRTMKQLQADTGLGRPELRQALGSALTKLRLQLT